MIIEHHKDGEEVETYHIYNEDDVFEQAKVCLEQLNLHPSVSATGTIFGSSNGVILTVDADNFHKFYIRK